MGISDCTSIETPLGDLKVDTTILEKIKKKADFFKISQKQDENEHSLEMQYPFVRFCLGENIKVVPIMIGRLEDDQDKKLACILQEYFDNDENLFIFSTDFCHWGENFGYKPMQEERNIYKYIENMDHIGINLILKKDAE